MAKAWYGLALCPFLCLASEPNAPLDHYFTLRNRALSVLEAQSRFRIDSASTLSFIFPISIPKDFQERSGIKTNSTHPLRYQQGEDALEATFVAAEEWRQGDAAIFSTEGGLGLSGFKSQLSFLLDARLFVEREEGGVRASFDREDVDHQDEQTTGSISYLSFSRYRGNINWDSQVGRFTVFRDAVHWGPGLFTNLVFHQDAVPFHGFSYYATLGPLSVMSLYGDLSIGKTQGQSPENLQSRNLYAHRYELKLGTNVLFGLSDQLILFKENKPYFFVPIFPLFLSKGTVFEESNNGNIGFDATWRWPNLGLIYTEFILDDLESPTSLIVKDYVQNKWGWMMGTHVKQDFGTVRMGAISEYSRLQPWVYTHFTSGTSQAANLGYPLGNQAGPNSQTMVLKGYARHAKFGYVGMKAGFTWKGRDLGSSMDDPSPHTGKASAIFLAENRPPDFQLETILASDWKNLGFLIQAQFSASPSILTRVSYWY
jgi:hypothetical protein